MLLSTPLQAPQIPTLGTADKEGLWAEPNYCASRLPGRIMWPEAGKPEDRMKRLKQLNARPWLLAWNQVLSQLLSLCCCRRLARSRNMVTRCEVSRIVVEERLR